MVYCNSNCFEKIRGNKNDLQPVLFCDVGQSMTENILPFWKRHLGVGKGCGMYLVGPVI